MLNYMYESSKRKYADARKTLPSFEYKMLFGWNPGGHGVASWSDSRCYVEPVNLYAASR